jgi:hypothetical protein
MRVKAQDEIRVGCSKRITLKKGSGIFRIKRRVENEKENHPKCN